MLSSLDFRQGWTVSTKQVREVPRVMTDLQTISNCPIRNTAKHSDDALGPGEKGQLP